MRGNSLVPFLEGLEAATPPGYSAIERKGLVTVPRSQSTLLAICELQLGTEHLDTVTGVSNLAMFYQKQKRYEEAEPLLKRVLAVTEQQSGPNHSRTQLVRSNYVSLLKDMGRNEEAKQLQEHP